MGVAYLNLLFVYGFFHGCCQTVFDTMDELEFHIDDDFSEEEKRYGIRDGILFLVDATSSMFAIDSSTEESHFEICLKRYARILAEKLSYNRQDWMGMILFGTGKGDTDPETKNIFTAQEMSPISIDKLKQIEDILSNVDKFHDNVGNSEIYPLHDVLWHAARTFASIKATMGSRKVCLITDRDNPFPRDVEERHRIRRRVQSYSDVGLLLRVIGLGRDWNCDYFYKDLEILSGVFDSANYKPTGLEDMEVEITWPSKLASNLPWRLGGSFALGVSIRNVSTKRKYLTRERFDRDTNEPLTIHKQWQELRSGDSDIDEEQESVLPTDLLRYHTFGGKNIYFKPGEVNSLRGTREPGFDLIGFKQTSIDPIHHCRAAKFITFHDARFKGSKSLFAALLKTCQAKNLMAVCAATLRKDSPTHLCSFVPCGEYGGFYMLKVLFREDVRPLRLPDHIYESTDSKKEEIGLCIDLIKRLKISYDPYSFPNPKLQKQMAHIEALALERDRPRPIRDCTVPDIDAMMERITISKDQFNEMFGTMETSVPPKKMAKLIDASDIEKAANGRKLDAYTVAQLREFLKGVGSPISGSKPLLLQRVYDHFRVSR